MSATILRAASLSAASWERLRHIYEVSFPASERDDWHELRDSIETGERACYVAMNGEELVGFGLVFPLRGVAVAFLEYLAVDPSERSNGVGGELLEHLAADSGASAAARGLVFEVEPVDEAEGSERALRERRLAFYLRHGATVVRGAPDYHAPDFAHEGETVRYRLLWMPAGAGAPDEPAGQELARCVEAILTQSYGLEAGDPVVQEVLRGLVA